LTKTPFDGTVIAATVYSVVKLNFSSQTLNWSTEAIFFGYAGAYVTKLSAPLLTLFIGVPNFVYMVSVINEVRHY